MNGNYYKNPRFPTIDDYNKEEEIIANRYDEKKELLLKEFLLLNRGKKVNTYIILKSKEELLPISGIIENIGTDYVVIKDIDNGTWKVVPVNQINYIEFAEKVDY